MSDLTQGILPPPLALTKAIELCLKGFKDCQFKEEQMNSPHNRTTPQEFLRLVLSAHDGLTSDAVAVFKKIMNHTFSALRSETCDEILDTVAVVRGYAELLIKYPELSSDRQRMADSLVVLSNLLESAGENEVSKEARWCAQFACSRDIESGRVIQPKDLDFRIW